MALSQPRPDMRTERTQIWGVGDTDVRPGALILSTLKRFTKIYYENMEILQH